MNRAIFQIIVDRISSKIIRLGKCIFKTHKTNILKIFKVTNKTYLCNSYKKIDFSRIKKNSLLSAQFPWQKINSLTHPDFSWLPVKTIRGKINFDTALLNNFLLNKSIFFWVNKNEAIPTFRTLFHMINKKYLSRISYV